MSVSDNKDGKVSGLLLEPAGAVSLARGGVRGPTVFVMGGRAGNLPAASRIFTGGETLPPRLVSVCEYVFVI